MVRNVHEAIELLKDHPEVPVETIIEGVVVEMRFKRRRTAADVFREAGQWEGETTEELTKRLRDARDAGGAKEPPTF